MITRQGLLTEACYLPSPYYDQRPANVAIDTIIIHCISLPKNEFYNTMAHRLFLGQLREEDQHLFSTDAWHKLTTLQVSAHILIDRRGGLWQFVSFLQRAWHAGLSSFHHRENCNDFSIGIELIGSDELPYNIVQYTVLSVVLKQLFAYYPTLNQNNIVGHSTVAPGRKTDPGNTFAWDALHYLLNNPNPSL